MSNVSRRNRRRQEKKWAAEKQAERQAALDKLKVAVAVVHKAEEEL